MIHLLLQLVHCTLLSSSDNVYIKGNTLLCTLYNMHSWNDFCFVLTVEKDWIQEFFCKMLLGVERNDFDNTEEKHLKHSLLLLYGWYDKRCDNW